jgi:Ca-activated chloride channel family protein
MRVEGLGRVAASAALAATCLAAQAPAAVRVKITAPEDDSYISGPTLLKADIDPAGDATAVTFFADGRQVCRLSKAPFECEWDAGAAIAEHQIRVVVSAAGGVRVVDTIATKGAGFAESVDVDLVHVTASVVDGKKYLRGLPRTAFRVFEDGQPQAITHFASEGVPLDLVLAIDVSSSMTESMPKVKTTVKEFLGAISPKDQVTVLGFNDSIFTLTRKSSDPATRLRAVDRLAPWGATALYDTVIAGVDLLGRETGRKAILVFTDGEDQGSHAAISDAERKLESSGVTLYMIGQGRGIRMEPLKKTMNRLAGASGGRAFVTEKIDDLRQAFGEVLDELSNQYLLGYTSTNPRRDGTLRKLKVEVDGHHQVRAREAYRAPGAR